MLELFKILERLVTRLMGILNVTPDSFSDQGNYFDHEKAIERAFQMETEGADIIDIGGESTRPGATAVSLIEELERVIPVIKAIRAKTQIQISIDTMKVEVAAEAIKAGANFINDVTGFRNFEMIELAASSQVEICVMHMKGTPPDMQNQPIYKEGIIQELLSFFDSQINVLQCKGVKQEQIILDPGIGFGKSVADNFEIIHNLHKFKALGFPLLTGVSRKSFMGKIVNKPASLLLPATLGLNTIALMSHVDIIRVHDIEEHRMLIDLMQHYLE